MNLQKLWRLALTVVGIGIVLLVPWVSSVVRDLAIRVFIFGLMAMSVSFLGSQVGLVSLMPSVFFAVSGYTVAVLQVQYGISFPIPPLLGIFGAIVVAALISFIVLRTRGVYFLILTMVIGLAVWALALQMSSITGGTTGIIGVRAPTIVGVSLGTSRMAFYYSAFIMFSFAIVVYVMATRSRFGLALRGIRESESRMSMLGYPVFWIKSGAFILSALFAALGGVIFTYFYNLLSPDAISLMPNVNALLASILGGMRSLPGVILGVTIVQTLDSLLRSFTQRYILISGIIFLLVILFLPKGITGTLKGSHFSFPPSLFDKRSHEKLPRGSGKEDPHKL